MFSYKQMFGKSPRRETERRLILKRENSGDADEEVMTPGGTRAMGGANPSPRRGEGGRVSDRERGRERYEDLALFDGLARLSRPSPCFAPLASLS
ncbi:MAG TPA: hypothetical protein VNM92_01640, partial [Thermoanaerobaculia bacterium]|nr:hypothetical protein [Thermoanaerobaculia bacterium]